MIRELLHQAIDPNIVQQAALLGTTTSTIHRLRKRQQLHLLVADRWAVRLGYHPALVWGDLWWEGAEEEMARRIRRVGAACA